jgi:hypothetical protein
VGCGLRKEADSLTTVREAVDTVTFVDETCARCLVLLGYVCHVKQCTALHVDLLAETKRTSLSPSRRYAKTRR